MFERILASFPRSFFTHLVEHVQEAYETAYRHAHEAMGDQALYARCLGSNRHFQREKALKRAAEAAGLAYKEFNGRYPHILVTAGRFQVMEVKVDRWGDLPREADCRKTLAAANPFTATQQDLFPDPDRGDLLACVVVENPSAQEQVLPQRIGFGVPTANLDAWACLYPVGEILAAYTDRETDRLIDRARPKLRVSKARQAEGED